MTNLDRILKTRDITSLSKVHMVKAMVFPVVIYGYESWTENQIIDAFELWMLEKTLESALDCKEIKLVHPKGNQFWIFTGRIDAKAETSVLCPPDVKDWLIRKDPGAGKYWSQEEKGRTEDEMVGWHHQLDRHDLNKLQELVMYRKGSLACFSPWSGKELDTLSD